MSGQRRLPLMAMAIYLHQNNDYFDTPIDFWSEKSIFHLSAKKDACLAHFQAESRSE